MIAKKTGLQKKRLSKTNELKSIKKNEIEKYDLEGLMKQENDVRRMKGSSGSCWNVWRMIREHKGSLTNKDKSTTDSDNLLKVNSRKI